MLKEFREIIARGNVMELAVAVILGVAFGAMVNSDSGRHHASGAQSSHRSSGGGSPG